MTPLWQAFADLVAGRVLMSRVFWEYAVCYGTILNLLTTAASFALVAGDYPGALAAAIFLIPVPYNLLMVVAVWRSAVHFKGREIWSVLARALIVIWAVLATLI